METIQNINVENILLYTENPRHEVTLNQRETLDKLISKVGSSQMYNLLEDIYLNGLIGANLPVLVFDSKIDKYIVYEGNRRISCIKIINNPNILKDIDEKLMKKVLKLKKDEKHNKIDEIKCLLTTKERAYYIMEIIHSGENQGKGVKQWNSKEKQEFSKEGKKVNIGFIIADTLTKNLSTDVTKKFR